MRILEAHPAAQAQYKRNQSPSLYCAAWSLVLILPMYPGAIYMSQDNKHNVSILLITSV
ncbi:hypothetical protein HanRHA438_Chr16g0762251 [Helianthus annuus]|nr:hypothetical protein HanRHA438_Chr16g0762251 [Helianthus annuus]